MILERRSDWESRLAAHLAAMAAVPHRYGKHDCLLAVAGAVKAQTGFDPGRGHRGKYRSALSARRYLDRLGHKNEAAMLDALFPERPVALARRGDVVIDATGAPGIVIGSDALFVGEAGHVRKPRAEWVKGWSIG